MFGGKGALVLMCLSLSVVLDCTLSAPSDENIRRQPRRTDCNCECGITNKRQRVVGGNVTKMHEFPWIAGMSVNGEFHCAAALITSRHLITAAHCVNGFNKKDLTVILADHDRQSNNRFSHIVVRSLKTVRTHEHFDKASYNNDIAILELDDPVEFSERVSPVCLPEDGFQNYYGRTGIIAGWGKITEKGEPSHILRKVAVPIWDKEQCYASGYGENKLSENMFCAGYPEGAIDACRGDSGGPLQMGNELGDMELVGVVSWGRGCARPNFPGIYTKVGNYLHWIEEHLEDQCLCQSSLLRLKNYD